jgi:hypothetical protein
VTTDHTIQIDPAVLGVWQDEDGESMLLLKYSDTEYLIEYPTGAKAVFYRGYPVKVGDLSCVQIQELGTADGPEENAEPYDVMSYRFVKDDLEVRSLNSDVVSKDAKSSDELRESILKNKANPELFHEPGIFKKVPQKS